MTRGACGPEQLPEEGVVETRSKPVQVCVIQCVEHVGAELDSFPYGPDIKSDAPIA
jgi:hypothetical protein